jgi:NAD(P)-dependent dehydrogenase (short-subunit alcohol dehydrogenase family)
MTADRLIDVDAARGRSAVVTGAGGGIGRAVARSLAQSGYSVVGLDLEFADTPASGVEQIAADITEQTSLAKIADSLPAASLDVVVNAAAVRPTGSILNVEPDAWRRCFEVNITGAYLVSRAFLPKMRSNSTIVHLSSGAAYGRRDLAAYAASKAALISMTKCMALDHADQGIRVNAVVPGTTATPMLEQMWGEPSAALTARESPRTTTGRVLSADDVARGITDVINNCTLTSGAVIPIGLLPYEW